MRAPETYLLGWSLSILLAGAFGPFIVTWLISTTGNPLAPAFYVAAGASISALAVAATRDRTAERLQD